MTPISAPYDLRSIWFASSKRALARLLGTSIKAVHSYEQGWRNVPPHAERQILFLLVHAEWAGRIPSPCWEILDCPEDQKSRCPAWEFKAGSFCWFINGTICGGEAQQNWKEKMRICRACSVLKPYICSTAKASPQQSRNQNRKNKKSNLPPGRNDAKGFL